MTRHQPLHLNFKVSTQIRNEDGLQAFKRALENARKYISIIHYSLQHNHIHLIVEADSNRMLALGMRSFGKTFSHTFDRGLIRQERYHLHVLKTPHETRNSFRYVLLNDIHHSKRKEIVANFFSSLHLLDAKKIAREYEVVVRIAKDKEKIELDQPSSWLGKQGLKPS